MGTHDLAAVDNATARKLIDEHTKIGEAIRRQLYSHLERDDVLQIVRLAILEAHLSYDPAKGASEKHWIRLNIQWRLADLAREQVPELQYAERTGTDPQLVNGADPDERFWNSTMATRALRVLSPRHRMIVDARLQGESFREIGRQIGISFQRVHKEARRAFKILRETLVVETGVDIEPTRCAQCDNPCVTAICNRCKEQLGVD